VCVCSTNIVYSRDDKYLIKRYTNARLTNGHAGAALFRRGMVSYEPEILYLG
jgi:hypothetical protein